MTIKKSLDPLKKSLDPFYDRELKKYKRPITSREHILSLLQAKEYPCSLFYLLKDFGLDTILDEKSLSYRLKAMIRDKQIIERYGYYCLPHFNRRIANGYVKFDYSTDIFFVQKYKYHHLATSYRKMLFDGDYIEGELLGYYSHSKDPLWRVKKIIRRNTTSFWGYYRVNEDMGEMYIELLCREKYSPAIMLPADKKLAKQLTNNILVEVEVVLYPTDINPCIVKLKRIINNDQDYASAHERFLQIVSHRYSLNLNPCSTLEDQTLAEVQQSDYKGRINLCDKTFITIDSETTQDVDDAVYVESIGNGEHILYVAIADVAHYVRPGNALDIMAQRHMTSIYFPNETIHMLPKQLSTNLCSLLPNKIRLAMVCEMRLDKKGDVVQCTIYEAVIKSAGAITYKQIDRVISKELKLESKLQSQVNMLHQTYKRMAVSLNKKGKLILQRSEASIVFDNNNIPTKIKFTTPTMSNDMIEVFMVTANQQVARYMKEHNMPCIYRTNLPPSADKLDSLKRILSDLGVKHARLTTKPKSYQNLLKQHDKHPDRELIHIAVIKNLQPARYTTECFGHFGLGLDEYSHFTSPIRRYADLIVHQILKNHIHLKNQISTDHTNYIARMCSIKSSYVDWAVKDLIRFNTYSLLKIQNIQEVEATFIYEKDSRLYFSLTNYYVDGWIVSDDLKLNIKDLTFGKKMLFGIKSIFPEIGCLRLKML
jgi:ribonuclease R